MDYHHWDLDCATSDNESCNAFLSTVSRSPHVCLVGSAGRSIPVSHLSGVSSLLSLDPVNFTCDCWNHPFAFAYNPLVSYCWRLSKDGNRNLAPAFLGLRAQPALCLRASAPLREIFFFGLRA
jgi:hypothetical protein